MPRMICWSGLLLPFEYAAAVRRKNQPCAIIKYIIIIISNLLIVVVDHHHHSIFITSLLLLLEKKVAPIANVSYGPYGRVRTSRNVEGAFLNVSAVGQRQGQRSPTLES